MNGEHKINIGDECYYNFELVKILKMEEDVITEVGDKFTKTCWSEGLDCYPNTQRNKEISDYTRDSYKKISETNINGLNFPDIHRKFVELWMCMIISQDNECEYTKYINRMRQFRSDIIDMIENVKELKVQGVYIFKQ